MRMPKEKKIERRGFFLHGLNFLAAKVSEGMGELAERERRAGVPIRPPGAVDEEAFLSLCTKCDDCLKACPHGSIKKAGGEWGRRIKGTPVIIPSEGPCRLCEDLPCIKACAPKALLPVKDRSEVRMGTARIKKELCFAWSGASGVCLLCSLKCPLRGTAIIVDDSKPVVIEEKCAGCGLCESACIAINNPPAIKVEKGSYKS
ncbi:MAG: 4Fe-4S dicluster domain-containing protein [Nitrospinae bacterium]|nr:4Fe-4S dicluster domain-containing protein [Nitrospinota bacterium]